MRASKLLIRGLWGTPLFRGLEQAMPRARANFVWNYFLHYFAYLNAR